MKCSRCGHDTPEGNFCGECGQRLSPPATPPPVAAGAAPQAGQPAQPYGAPPANPHAAQPMPPYGAQPMPPQGARPMTPPGAQPLPPGGPQQMPPYGAQPMPPYGAPAPRPYMAPPKKSPWAIWAISLIVTLVVGLGAVVLLLGDEDPPVDPGDNPVPQSGQTTPANQPPAKDNAQVSLAARGNFGMSPDFMDVNGQYIVAGTGSEAVMYSFQAGKLQKLGSLNPRGEGELIDLTLGRMYNSDETYMVAIYPKKVYIMDRAGDSRSVETEVDTIRIGDYDGDGQIETIFQYNENGRSTYAVWRYFHDSSQSAEVNTITTQEETLLYVSHLTLGKQQLLLGFDRIAGFEAYLYTFDMKKGPQVFGSYEFPEEADSPHHWMAANGLSVGPTILLSRGGAKPTVEVLKVGTNGSTSLGRISVHGKGGHAVAVGGFTANNKQQILAIDEEGSYFVYDLQ